MPASPGSAYPYPSQRVIVLRHGERRDNHPDAPAESNPPLTPEGIAAVEGAAARLKRYIGEEAARAAVLVVSPFLRTVQTAEALQRHGVGTDHGMVVDNTLCEVFGPSRIKASRAPQLPAYPTSRAVGGLPVWGESLETATERYVANFLRNGDVYGGPLARGAGASDSSFSGREESQTSSTLLCPVAVSKRVSGGAGNNGINNNGSSNGVGAALPSSPGSAQLSNVKCDKTRDVVLVTHGDAISAILSHFYPARVVYEAEFLSFIIMRRYGAGNHVYHLDESTGVNWFVEGVDREPQDPVLNALEMEREAAAAAAAAEKRCRDPGNTTANKNRGTPTNPAYDEDIGDDNDDEGDSLDNDAEEPTHPASFAGGRVKASRSSRLPARRVRPSHTTIAKIGEEATATGIPAFPPTQVYPPVLNNPHQPVAHHRRGTSPGNGAAAAQTRTAHVAGSSSGSNGGDSDGPHNPSRRHPKAGEDCERNRLPGGTPAQSSSNPVLTTTDDGADLRRGHSSRSGSSGSGVGGNPCDTEGSGYDVEGEERQESGNTTAMEEGFDDGTVEEEATFGVAQRHVVQCVTRPKDVASTASLRWTSDGWEADAVLRDMSSYGGLTTDTSADSWVKWQAASISNFSALAPREKTVTVVQVPSQQPAPSPPLLPTASSVAHGAPVTPATTPPPRLGNTSITTTSTTCTRSRSSSASVPPTFLHDENVMAHTPNDATALLHDDATSFSSGITNLHAIQGTASSSTRPGTGYTISLPESHALQHATWEVSKRGARNLFLALRAVQMQSLQFAQVFRENVVITMFYCLCIAWDTVSMMVLFLSCNAQYPLLLYLRRAVEQLRFRPLGDLSGAHLLNGYEDLHDDSTVSTVTAGAVREDEHVEVPFHQLLATAATEDHGGRPMTCETDQHAVTTNVASRSTSVQGDKRTANVGRLCVRHVVATAAKILFLFSMSILISLMAESDGRLVLHSVEVALTSILGVLMILVCFCANVVRGVLDEMYLDPILDQH
jgi:broad specificity phosphatase PhoE